MDGIAEQILELVQVANLAASIRRVQQGGREWIVAPATSIVPGVLNGSQGALFYPADEVENTHKLWDGIPITLFHPIAPTGGHVSAHSPGILKTQGIGVLQNSAFKGKLTHEMWFDVARTREADKRHGTDVLNRLERGEPIELSTGLYTENEPAKPGANHNGRGYEYVARKHKPDHLAVLPNAKGACSLDDGCGVLVNCLECGKQECLCENTWTDEAREASALARQGSHNSPAHSHTDAAHAASNHPALEKGPHQTFARQAQADVEAATHLVGKAANPAAVKAKIKSIAKRKGLSVPDAWKTTDNKETAMPTRDDNVQFLVANCDCFKGRDDLLANEDAYPDDLLENLVSNTKRTQELVTNAAKPVVNAKAADCDDDEAKDKPMAKNALTEWEKSMPAEALEVWNAAKKVAAGHKGNLIERLTANVQGDEAKQAAAAVYNAMKPEQLEALAATLPVQAVTFNRPLPSYLGASGGPVAKPAQNKAGDQDDVLPIPTWNYGTERNKEFIKAS
jgi:hypothetical protein